MRTERYYVIQIVEYEMDEGGYESEGTVLGYLLDPQYSFMYVVVGEPYRATKFDTLDAARHFFQFRFSAIISYKNYGSPVRWGIRIIERNIEVEGV